jgi:hypothetical protein
MPQHGARMRALCMVPFGSCFVREGARSPTRLHTRPRGPGPADFGYVYGFIATA